MAIREILQLPHPKLRMRAKKVRSIDGDVLHLAQDMVDTMRKAEGVGLAANQVGELRRVIVIQLPGKTKRASISTLRLCNVTASAKWKRVA